LGATVAGDEKADAPAATNTNTKTSANRADRNPFCWSRRSWIVGIVVLWL
jgi:hypothetical protein